MSDTGPDPELAPPPAKYVDLFAALGWPFFIRALALSASIAVLIGVPTDVLPNPWFTRMTPVPATAYVFWIASSALTGAVLATGSISSWFGSTKTRGAGATGGILAWLAIGCPICNKLVVGLLGISGALTYFGPLQPLIGTVSIALGLGALLLRLRALRGRCLPVPGSTSRCAIAPEAPPQPDFTT